MRQRGRALVGQNSSGVFERRRSADVVDVDLDKGGDQLAHAVRRVEEAGVREELAGLIDVHRAIRGACLCGQVLGLGSGLGLGFGLGLG